MAFLRAALLLLSLSMVFGCGDSPEESVEDARDALESTLSDARRAVEDVRARMSGDEPWAEAPADLDAAERELGEAIATLEELLPQLEAARDALLEARQGLAALERVDPSSVAAPPPAAPPPDPVLFRMIQRQLLEAPALARVAIAAEVKDARVILRGSVPDWQTRVIAEEIALGVEGVAGVENRIDVAGER